MIPLWGSSLRRIEAVHETVLRYALTRQQGIRRPQQHVATHGVAEVIRSQGVTPQLHRDAFAQSKDSLPAGYVPLRHIGLYAYRNDFLQAYPALAVSPLEAIEALEQLRVLWHGYPIAVHVTDSAPAAGVDTPEDLERVRKHY